VVLSPIVRSDSSTAKQRIPFHCERYLNPIL
jgi:hypothetical protein